MEINKGMRFSAVGAVVRVQENISDKLLSVVAVG